MWFKNTINNTFNNLNRPSKLLRLDSTGETSKENCDNTPAIQVISALDAKKLTEKKSCFDFSPQRSFLSLGLVNNMGSCGFMNNLSSKYRGKEREIMRKDVESVTMSRDKVTMRSSEIETQSGRSWPNCGRTSRTHQKGFWTNPRNFSSLKVPADSPWLKVNSGYFQPPHQGSYNNYHSHFGGSRNNFCDKNNNSNNRIKAKHKKRPDEKRVRVTPSHSSVDPKPLVHDVCSKELSTLAKPPVSDVCSKTILAKPTVSDVCGKTILAKPPVSDACGKVPSETKPVIKDLRSSTILAKPPVSDVCSKSENKVPQDLFGCATQNKLVSVVKEVGTDPTITIESESRIKTCPSVINVSYTLDSCVADLFQDVESNPRENCSPDSKETRNFQIQCEPNNQQIRITEMAAAPNSLAIPSAINSQNSDRHIHLSIIGGKCQSKQQTPPNSVSSQSKINEDCQSNKTTPTDSNQSKQNCDSKSAQEKNCSLCTAYISRLDPKCKEFPKSAGCDHSTILLRVRDTPKKTKKRKNCKEKVAVKKSSPSTFIVGVNSSKSPENSHVFQFVSNCSESDDSWDSFDDDEDETDSAACDWSKLEMDKLFPGGNGLFNPIQFNVHISQSEPETGSSSSSTESNYLDDVNLSWNIHIYDENQSKPSACQKSNTQKKVRFEEDEKLVTVHRMVAWSYAYRASRKGPWEEYARDRERFHRRIRDSEEVLSQILKDCHRFKIYNSLYK